MAVWDWSKALVAPIDTMLAGGAARNAGRATLVDTARRRDREAAELAIKRAATVATPPSQPSYSD